MNSVDAYTAGSRCLAARSTMSGALPNGGLERRPQIFGLAHIEQQRLDTERSRRRLHGGPLTRDGRVAHVEQGRDPRGLRDKLFEQLDALGVYLGHGRAQAGEVARWMGETRDDALADRVADAGDDHWNQ